MELMCSKRLTGCSLVSWKYCFICTYTIFFKFPLNFLSFSPYSQPQERSRTKTHLMHLPPREADLHPLSHQPHRAQDADQAEEKSAATASPPSLCHQGPSTRCFSNRPTGVVRTPEDSAAALCAWAGGYKRWNSWPTPTYDTRECTVDKLDPMLKNWNNQTSCHTNQ